MKTKDNSVQTQFHPTLTAFLFAANRAYTRWDRELIITCGSEHSAKHSVTSLHYAIPACAADVRSWAIEHRGVIKDASDQYKAIRDVRDTFCLARDMPTSWIEVILESNHIHIEFQPKRKRD